MGDPRCAACLWNSVCDGDEDCEYHTPLDGDPPLPPWTQESDWAEYQALWQAYTEDDN